MYTPNQKPATDYTRRANAGFFAAHSLNPDNDDFERARRGFIAAPDAPVTDAQGRVVWDFGEYGFFKSADAPETVNPSLWRQARLNAEAGLFEVADGIYQVRGFDISIITFVRGETGWVVIDTLTSCETSRAALELVNRHAGARPVKAVIYTHSHADHWAGVKGVLSVGDVAAGARVIAPQGFMDAAVSENVLAGNAMTRRGAYMFGSALPFGADGHIDCGIGHKVPVGSVSLIAPTEEIRETGERLNVDGVELVFQLTPQTEAPSEMNIFLPRKKALLIAEIVTHGLHNIYTIRGTEVRDSKGWAHYIDEAIDMFAGDCDVLFMTHAAPVWGSDAAVSFLKRQRDGYKYIHDQTLRMANQGCTMLEIAEMLRYPAELDSDWTLRGVYGTVHHNAKAVFQRYLGFYDGNPATLYQLPPEDAAKKYTELAGGADELMKKAQAAFDGGEYRWAAQLLNHLVFAEPQNENARLLLADSLEQLGYQAESAPWRNAFLSGARELRQGGAGKNIQKNASFDVVSAMSPEHLFDYIAVSINGEKAEGKRFSIHFDFTDISQQYLLTLEHSVINYKKGAPKDGADLAISIPKQVLIDTILSGRMNAVKALLKGKIKFRGNIRVITELSKLIEAFEPDFNIVTP